MAKPTTPRGTAPKARKPKAKGDLPAPPGEAIAGTASAEPLAAAPSVPPGIAPEPSGTAASAGVPMAAPGQAPSASSAAAVVREDEALAAAVAEPLLFAAAEFTPAAFPEPARPLETGVEMLPPLALEELMAPAPAAVLFAPEDAAAIYPDVAPEPPVSAPEPLPADQEPSPEEPPLAGPQRPQPEAQPHTPAAPSMFIVHITPELAPVAKVGGLADVVFGLANELEVQGHHVEIILPKYDCLRYDHIWGLCETFSDLWVPWYGGAIHCTVFFGFVHGRQCFFIEPHSSDNFFSRGGIYGFNDDILRYAFFSRAAIEFLWKSGKPPDIIHCHDWQTGLVPVFLYEVYQFLGMTHPRVCYTIHNFKHQGVTGSQLLTATGLNRPEYYFHYDRLRDNHNPHAINLMKAGLVYSNFVTTVSPRHAIEAKDHGEGFGLEPTLHIHHGKFGGVVNGIDYQVWNPESDRYIPYHYGPDNLDDKAKNKKALRDRLMLTDNDKPIVAFIGRLDPQKGLELIRHGIFYALHRHAQFVLLGASPDGQINNYFWGLKHQLNDNPDVHIEIGFNEELSHLIYAGADLMLVPSRYEPCGLTQLIALRYGTVPVVREVGGLADTVFDKDHSLKPVEERNGYVFRDFDYSALESALGRALSCYYDYRQDFRALIGNGMRGDHSWKLPAQDYLNIYTHLRAK